MIPLIKHYAYRLFARGVLAASNLCSMSKNFNMQVSAEASKAITRETKSFTGLLAATLFPLLLVNYFLVTF